MAFHKAAKRKLKARVAVCGPTGAGKTWTGLQLLRSLVGEHGKIAVIDTENKTASKYLGDAIDDFDVDEFESFELERYIKAIKAAAEAGYDGLLVDSLTHAWAGKGGALEKVDSVAAAQAARGWANGKKDNFSAWREVTPLHNELVETLIRFPGHLVVTMRSKMEYAKDENGKIRKLGMAPIQREGVEYEFDVVCDMDVDHNLIVSKTRCKALDGKMFKKPEGESLAKPLLSWLNDGAEEAPKPAPQPAPEPPKQTGNAVVYLKAQKALKESGLTPEQWREKAKAAGVEKPAKEYTQQDLDAVLAVIGGSKSGQEAAHG
jgi:DNA polymerase III delta prime subunit